MRYYRRKWFRLVEFLLYRQIWSIYKLLFQINPLDVLCTINRCSVSRGKEQSDRIGWEKGGVGRNQLLPYITSLEKHKKTNFFHAFFTQFFSLIFFRCLCQISNQFINFLQAFFLCCAFIVIITIYPLIGKINFLSYSQMFIFSYLPRFKSMYWLCIHKTFSHKKCVSVCITSINTIVTISNFLFSLLFCDNISCKNHY